MKKDLHPKFVDSQVHCACGAVFDIQSNAPEHKVGICSKCHPFYTGKAKLVDTEGRVDRFRRRYGMK